MIEMIIRYLSLVFSSLGAVMIISLGVYFGTVTAQSPHTAPFSGYANHTHFLYVGIYILLAAFFVYIGDWLVKHL
ncbi:MAG: hypothetical protein HYW34_03740 [Candidatus Brennerbacteria bacterium]|nr:hypothetical protein [Candidatus Brennerbacteria bacterium]